MASASITIRAVQALASGDVLWDGGHKEAVRGFGVRRQRDQATYVLKYRVFGRQRFFTIGPHGSPSTFDTLVAENLMPGPKRLRNRRIWDRKRLDECFDALDDGGSNPWD
jgi:hypothetical protein